MTNIEYNYAKGEANRRLELADEENVRLSNQRDELLESLSYLRSEVDAYFGPSKVGACWPSFLDSAMDKAYFTIANVIDKKIE